MDVSLPCPLCSFSNSKPRTRCKFKCKGCREYLELSKDLSRLQDFAASQKAKNESSKQWWHEQTIKRMYAQGLDYAAARQSLQDGIALNGKRVSEKAKAEKLKASEVAMPTPTPLKTSLPPQVLTVPTSNTTDLPWD